MQLLAAVAMLGLALPALAGLPREADGGTCASFSVTVSPASATVAVGGMQGFDATVMCDSTDVTANSNVQWTLVAASQGVGKISPLSGPKTTFYAMAIGQAGLMADAVYSDNSGVDFKGQGRAMITVGAGSNQCPVAVLNVDVAPASASLPVGGTQGFGATVWCGTQDVTAQATISWMVTTTIGSVSPTSGPTTLFTAMVAGSGDLVASATIPSGQAGRGLASITVGGGSNQCPSAVLKVDVAPPSASLQVGGTQGFSATVWCGTQDVTSQAKIDWTLTATIGSVAPPTGPQTLFTAATAGSADLVASASIPTGQAGRGLASIKVGGGGNTCSALLVTVSPGQATLAVGGTQAFGALVTCSGQDVTASSAITWTVNGGVGTVSPMSGPKTLFTATTPGTGAVVADASYQGAGGSGSATVTVLGGGATCNVLSVYVKPANIYTYVGTQVPFASMVDCDGKDVTSAASITWSVVGAIGTVSPTSGPTTVFSATTPGYGGVLATATYGGQSATGGGRVTVAGQAGVCLSMVVVLTPQSAMMKVGDVQRFEARVYCGNMDVTSKATISWGVLGGIGTVLPATGPSTQFTATNAGSGAVVALASLGGVDAIAYAKVLVA